ncbi:MAG: hypothetical protein HDS73_04965 [Bacteroidales bacterium]|nr:hypothetical protein [Bacteroidales bacterium]
MWKTVTKWLILVALLAYVLFAAAWSFAEASRRKCSGIEVAISGTQTVDTVTSKGVVAELAHFDKGIIGKPLSSLNTRDIEKYLNGLAHFEDVQCVITSSGKLRVIVRPMIPELRVFDGDKSYYINKDGKHITAKAQFFTDVPVVSGHFSESFPASTLIPVARFVEKDPVLSQLVTMIKANDPNNIILVPRFTGHVINIGDTTDLDIKRRSILATYKKILPHRGWETYDTISVKYRGQIIATRRDKSTRTQAPVIINEADPEEATLEGLAEHNADNKPATSKKPAEEAPENADSHPNKTQTKNNE